jgi:hypothetical protein
MAAPSILPGTESIVVGSYPRRMLFISCGLGMLFLHKYPRWRLPGSSSPFEHLPVIGDQNQN